MKRFLTLVLTISMMLTLVSVPASVHAKEADNTEEVETILGVPTYDISEASETIVGAVPTTSETATKYDPRPLGMVTAVESQSPYGTCWAHEVVACAEASFIKQGIYDNSLNISELTYAWVIYEANGKEGSWENFLNAGNTSTYIEARDKALPFYREPADGDKVNNVETEKVGYVSRIYRGHTTAEIKKLVANYGAAGVSIYAPETSAEYRSYITNYGTNDTSVDLAYNPAYIGDKTNHAVTIVGWDDNYPKESFLYSTANNGAWLVKNSWGMGNGKGSGYLWIPYDYVTYGESIITSLTPAEKQPVVEKTINVACGTTFDLSTDFPEVFQFINRASDFTANTCSMDSIKGTITPTAAGQYVFEIVGYDMYGQGETTTLGIYTINAYQTGFQSIGNQTCFYNNIGDEKGFGSSLILYESGVSVGMDKEDITVYSDNEDVATVSFSAYGALDIYAQGEGKANITLMKCNKFLPENSPYYLIFETFTVTMKQYCQSVEVQRDQISYNINGNHYIDGDNMQIGDSRTYTVTTTPLGRGVTYEVTKGKDSITLIQTDSGFTVTALKAGGAEITITSEDEHKTGTIWINIDEKPTEVPTTEAPTTEAPVYVPPMPTPTPTPAPTTEAPTTEAPAPEKPNKETVRVTKGNIYYTVDMVKGEATANSISAVKTSYTIADTVSYKGTSYPVTSFSKSLFTGNKKITKVTIGKNITTIPKNAFKNATRLKTVNLPNSLTEIQDNAFYGCKKLTKITIPKNVTIIGKNVFSGCKKLKAVTMKTKKLKKVGKNAFKGIDKKAVVKTPKGKAAAYRKLINNKKVTVK